MKAGVVVIGGGVIGTSIAFHLAEAGVPDVVLLERDSLASGSTSKAAGGVRAQFSDEVNVRLGARSLDAFAAFGQRPGAEIDLHRPGYLFLLSSEGEVAGFERSVAVQNALGVPSRMISVAEACHLSPLIEPDGLLAAAYSPDDGHCTPESVVQGYAAGARRHGARIVTGCEVVGVEAVGGEIRSVATTMGPVSARTVVCAAGAWSAAVGAMVGVDLPVVPYRRQILVTDSVPGVPAGLGIPMTIDFSTTFYFHREGTGLLLGMSDPQQRPGFSVERSDDWLPRLTDAIAARAPAVLDAGITGGWAGLYEVTPDHNALIGEARGSQVPGRFLYATGFSGHGFLQGPAVGEVIRDLYLGREPVVDVAPLSVDRFGGSTVPRLEINHV